MRPIATTLIRGLLFGWIAFSMSEGIAAGDLLRVTGAWVPPTAPGQSVGALYMQLRSEHDAALVKVETDASSAAEMHHMTFVNDVMRMRRLDQVALPAGQLVVLAPGGRHVMLVDLRQPLNIGDRVRVTLTFRLRDGSAAHRIVDAPVARRAAHGDHR